MWGGGGRSVPVVCDIQRVCVLVVRAQICVKMDMIDACDESGQPLAAFSGKTLVSAALAAVQTDTGVSYRALLRLNVRPLPIRVHLRRHRQFMVCHLQGVLYLATPGADQTVGQLANNGSVTVRRQQQQWQLQPQQPQAPPLQVVFNPVFSPQCNLQIIGNALGSSITSRHDGKAAAGASSTLLNRNIRTFMT